MFLINSGMRPNEAAHLKWKHIKISGDGVVVYLPDTRNVDGTEETFKTGGRTIVCLPDAKSWIEFRKDLASKYQEKDDCIFPTENNGPAKKLRRNV